MKRLLLTESIKITANKTRASAFFALLVMAMFGFSQQAKATCTAKFGVSVSGLTATFTDSSSASGSYTSSWTFGDGSSSSSKSPSHTYANKDSTYKVCLIISDTVNKCKTYLCKSVTIKNTGCAVSFTYSVSGLAVTFKNTSASKGSFTSSWFFGDGTSSTTFSPSHTFSKDSTYNVCLKVTDSSAKCTAYYCSKITVKSGKGCSPSFTYSASGRTISFTNTSTASHSFYQIWDFGDKNKTSTKSPSHTYAGMDTVFTVCLTVVDTTAGCSTTTCKTIKVPAVTTCTASFTYSASGRAVSFTNTSTSPKSYTSSWSFGDGNYSTSASPSHTFSKDSTYYVCLKITDSAGKCSNTYCAYVTVKAAGCSASFTYKVSGRTVTFTNTSSSKYSFTSTWDFADKSSSTSTSPSHTYAGTDTVYHPCLSIYDSAAKCSTYYCAYIKVAPAACAASYTYTVSGRTVTFTNTSTAKNAFSSAWFYGDGSSASTKSPSHTYSKDSTYYACLKITDSVTGCYSYYCAYIKISTTSCAASFSYKVSGRTVSFTNTSSSKYSFTSAWDFGDKTTSTTTSPSHTYSGSDTIFKVCLVIYDSSAKCSTYYCTTIKVPVAACTAGYTYKVSGRSVSFTNTSTAKHGFSSAWYFGDGSSASTTSPSHTYSKDSTYYACLRITDSVTGCYSYSCSYITIKTGTCTASFKDSVSGRTVYFKNTSTAKNSFISSWDFGDKSTSSSTNPSHTYSGNDSAFKICLIIKDTAAKCTTYYCAYVAVKVYCKPGFSYTDSARTIYFKNTSVGVSGHKISYAWFFGDGSSSTSTSPTHTYSKDSTYYACVKMTDSVSGCVAYSCQYITIATSYYIAGRVYADSNLAYPGIIYLITYSAKDSSLKAISYTKLTKDTTSAIYYFKGIWPGTYYTKAALDTSSKVYKSYLPTYHTKATKWAYADKIVVTTKNITNADIHMEKGTNKGGKGFIGGKISAGANKVGDPLPNVEVMLFDATGNNAIGYTYSDANGNFKFDNLDYGTYEVYAEVLGLPTYPAWVTLSETKQTDNSTSIIVNSTQVRAISGIVVEKANKDNIKIYPNPVRNDLMVNINSQAMQQANMSIYDINGRLISQSNMQIAPGQQVIQLNTRDLSNGMYFLKVQLGHEQAIIQSPFIKVSK